MTYVSAKLPARQTCLLTNAVADIATPTSIYYGPGRVGSANTRARGAGDGCVHITVFMNAGVIRTAGRWEGCTVHYRRSNSDGITYDKCRACEGLFTTCYDCCRSYRRTLGRV